MREYRDPPKIQLEIAGRSKWEWLLVVAVMAPFCALIGLALWNPALVVQMALPLVAFSFSMIVVIYAARLRRMGQPWGYAFFALVPIPGLFFLHDMTTRKRVKRSVKSSSNYPRLEDNTLNEPEYIIESPRQHGDR